VEVVNAGSEAEQAGLHAGETVLEINGKTAGLESSQEIARLNPGDSITVKVRSRRGGDRELKWKMGSREEISYELNDMETLTKEQRAQRAAWLKGEAETPPGEHSE
jgi:predicted metalloprotease with PDZ domain